MPSLLIKLPTEIKLLHGNDDVTPIQIEITNPIAARLVLNILRLGPENRINLPEWWSNASWPGGQELPLCK
jgi:hypothetical protein